MLFDKENKYIKAYKLVLQASFPNEMKSIGKVILKGGQGKQTEVYNSFDVKDFIKSKFRASWNPDKKCWIIRDDIDKVYNELKNYLDNNKDNPASKSPYEPEPLNFKLHLYDIFLALNLLTNGFKDEFPSIKDILEAIKQHNDETAGDEFKSKDSEWSKTRVSADIWDYFKQSNREAFNEWKNKYCGNYGSNKVNINDLEHVAKDLIYVPLHDLKLKELEKQAIAKKEADQKQAKYQEYIKDVPDLTPEQAKTYPIDDRVRAKYFYNYGTANGWDDETYNKNKVACILHRRDKQDHPELHKTVEDIDTPRGWHSYECSCGLGDSSDSSD